jgi:hypothetical protein
MSDLRDRLRQAAGPEPAPTDTTAIIQAAARRRARRWTGRGTVAVAAVTAIVAMGLLSLPTARVRFEPTDRPPAEGSVRLPLPPLGSVSPEFLDPTRPVFVVHHIDGRVSVLDAHSPHVATQKLLAWCEAGAAFIDVQHGSIFNQSGQYAFGPSPTGMAAYNAQASDGTVIVGAPTAAPPRPSERIAQLDTEACWPAEGEAITGDGYRYHYAEADAVTPEEALVAGESLGVVVDGLLEQVGLQPARLCGDPAPNGLPRCPSDAPVADVYRLSDRDPEPGLADSYHHTDGRFVVDVNDGRITSLTFTAVSAASAGFFRGSDEYSGELHLPGDYAETAFRFIGLARANPKGDGDLWLSDFTDPYGASGRTTRETGSIFIPDPTAVRVEATLSTGAAITTVDQLRSAQRAGTLASTSFTVVIDKRSKAVIALRQQR